MDYKQVNQAENSVKKIKRTREYISFNWNKYYPYLAFPAQGLASFFLLIYVYINITEFENKYEVHGIKKGYFGFYQDVQDSQWRSFQGGFKEIFIVASIFLGVSKWLRNQCEENNNISKLIWFNLLFGMGFAGYLFHIGIIYWLIETLFSFLLIKLFVKSRFFPLIIWGSQLIILYFNEMKDGYGFKWISQDTESIWHQLERDMHDGSEIRWHVMYNLTVLKVISFGMDQFWSAKNKVKFNKKDHKCPQCDNNELCYKARQEQNIDLQNFTLVNYLAYIVYAPLFIAGPITTFNAWISHVKRKQTLYKKPDLIKYVCRNIFILITFEIYTHVCHAFAILTNKNNALFYKEANMMLLGATGIISLVFIWYKFVSIWRIFRTWALLDGFDTPENMNRCMLNNYCFEGFWRSWHRSFNQWLIRYIFIPCGGSRYKAYNIWVVFTFVAVWHDISMNLIVWAWVICLALVPEMACKAFFGQAKYNYLWKTKSFKFLCGLAGGIDITLMVFANLVGFGNGKDGVEQIMLKLFTFEGLLSYFKMVVILTPHAVCQFWIRDKEARQQQQLGY